jgi:hypothetical protein
MKGKLILLGLVMTAALVFSGTARARQKPAEKPAVKPQKPLIWIDLLLKKAGRTTAAGRDLFSPQSAARSEGLPLVMPKVKTAPANEGASSGESIAPPLTLHYIGYSYNETKQKFVALVFFEDQVTAVQEGDILPMGWKVLKITAKELHAEGPDKKPLTFSREGEQR